MIYRYGDSWEKYPIRAGEIWSEARTGSIVSVRDITAVMPVYMLKADMVYCDPPWSLGNVNCFYTKAGHMDRISDFGEFSRLLFERIQQIGPKVCYVEIGKQNREMFLSRMREIFSVVQYWEIRYYNKYPCFLIRGGSFFQEFNFAKYDDSNTPFFTIEVEEPNCIADLCTGQGLTAVAAFRNGRRFVGTELNPRRLAVAIDRVNKLGGEYARSVS